jgi:AcrR family transcriptional regulator
MLERNEVIDRMTRTFRSHGYDGTSLAQLSEGTGLRRASLYHHFPEGKEAMAKAVLSRVLERFAAELTSNRPDHERPTIKRFLAVIRDYLGRGELTCLMGNLAMSAPSGGVHGTVVLAFEQWLSALTDIFTLSGRPHDEARQCAEDVVLRVEGALLLSRAVRDPGILDREFAKLEAQYQNE